MTKLISLTSAVALAVSAYTVSAADVVPASLYTPPAPFTMNAGDQQKRAEQHIAFIERQAAAHAQAMEAQQKFVEHLAADQVRMMEQQHRAMENFFQEQQKMHAHYASSVPAPFTVAEMPAHLAFPEMPEMPAPMSFEDMPELPAFEEFASMDPEARRGVMETYRDEVRQAMQKRRGEMRKQLEERKVEARQVIQERRDNIAKERARFQGRDV